VYNPERKILSNDRPKELRPATRQPCPGMSGQDNFMLQSDCEASPADFRSPQIVNDFVKPQVEKDFPKSLNAVPKTSKTAVSPSPNSVSPPLLSRLAQLSEATSFNELMSVSDTAISSVERSLPDLEKEYVTEIEDEQGRQLLLFPILKPPAVQDMSSSKRSKKGASSSGESELAPPDTG
jgi:hypothetical protein